MVATQYTSEKLLARGTPTLHQGALPFVSVHAGNPICVPQVELQIKVGVPLTVR